MTFDDSITHCQTQASPKHALGSIERLEHTLAHLFLHARSGICKPEAETLAVAITTNGETAALRHGVNRVDDQINEHLTQLRSVAESQQTLFGIQRHINIKTRGARFVLPTRARDLDRVAQEAADVEQLELCSQRFARERLNAPHRRRGILGRSYNNAETANQLFILNAA